MAGAFEAVLKYLTEYGPIVLALVLFIAGLGIPMPAALLALAAGALARQGRFSLFAVFLCAIIGSASGSSGSYLMGRYGLTKAFNRLKQKKTWGKAEELFRTRGPWAIVLTRFLLTPLALPTTLIAGAERYSLLRFAFFSAIGALLWVSFYGGLGYAFAASWRTIGSKTGMLGVWAVLAAGILYGLYHLWNRHRNAQNAPVEPAAAD